MKSISGMPHALGQEIYHYLYTGSSWYIDIKTVPWLGHIKRFGEIIDDLRETSDNPVGKLKLTVGA